MIKLEKNLIDIISENLGIHPENFRGIFNIEIFGNQVACSSEIFVLQNGEYMNVQSQMTSEQWFSFLKNISDPLVQIYKNQEFAYLMFKTSSIKPDFTYEKNNSITISNRFILWEYDEFGIGNRGIPLYSRVLDEYRPLNKNDK